MLGIRNTDTANFPCFLFQLVWFWRWLCERYHKFSWLVILKVKQSLVSSLVVVVVLIVNATCRWIGEWSILVMQDAAARGGTQIWQNELNMSKWRYMKERILEMKQMLDMNALDCQQNFLVKCRSPCQMGSNNANANDVSYIFLLWCCDVEDVQSVWKRHMIGGILEEKQWILVLLLFPCCFWCHVGKRRRMTWARAGFLEE
jgi:hypothetical protein